MSKQRFLLNLSKVCYLVLTLYMAWFQVAFFQIKYMSQILGGLLILFLLLHLLLTKKSINQTFPIELKIWIMFGIIVLFFGFINATNKALHINATFRFFQHLILTWAIITISIHEKSVSFFTKGYILLALLSAITTLLVRYPYSGGRFTMGPENNPNSLGISMVFAIGFVLLELDTKKVFSTILYLLLQILFIYITFLTGSRKSIIGIVIIIVFWLFLVTVPFWRKASFFKKTNLLIAMLGFASLIFIFIKPILVEFTLIERMQSLFTGGESNRTEMYKEALSIFNKYPLFGAGMEQYRVLSVFKTYSHSTYAESIANTGLVGSILYFTTYLIIGVKLIENAFSNSKDTQIFRNNIILFIIFITVLFLAIGIIHFYTLVSFIYFGVVIANLYVIEGKRKHE